MKKLLLTALLLAFASTSFALDAFVGVYGGSINYDKALYSVETNPGGASIGIKQDLGDTPFFVRLEGVATEHALSPSAGIGVNLGSFTLSAGLVADNEERASYVFGGIYNDGYNSDEFTSKYVEATMDNIFVRYSEYTVNHNFIGSSQVFGVAAATKSISEDNSIIKVGYRHKF